mgnify:CR=1 FL=1
MTRRLLVTPITVAVHLDGDSPGYGDSTTHITVEDDGGGGGYVVIQQFVETAKPGEVRFDADELRVVAKQADIMVKAYDRASKVAA